MKKWCFCYLRKIVATSCWVLILSACGRNIESSSEPQPVVLTPAAESNLIRLKVKTENSNTAKAQYITKSSGWARVPSKPFIFNSSAKVIYTKLTFTFESTGDFSESVVLTCDYISSRKADTYIDREEKSYNHQFIGCNEDVDLDGIPDKLNYIPGDEFPIDKNLLITLDVHSSDQSDQIELESDIEVDWR
jgi:hypothetical protein